MTEYSRCPRCSAPVYDNRADQAQGLKAKWPQFKCTDRACGWAVWLQPKRVQPTDSAPVPDVCPRCQEGPEWWPLVVERTEKGRREQVVIHRYLIRHQDDMACGRFNGAHRWQEADPTPGGETGIGLG